MKAFYPLFLLATLLFAGSCGTQGSDTESEVLIVDVLKKYPTKRIKLQDIADVEYIPLETSDEFLWGGWLYSITDDYILNADIQNGNITLFDRKGKGIRTFNRQGNSGEEYSQYCEIILDEENKEIIANDVNHRKLFIYDMEGKFKRVLTYAQDKIYNSIVSFDANRYLIYNQPYEDEAVNTYLLVSKTDGALLNEFNIPATGKKITTKIQTGEGDNRMIISFASFPISPMGPGFILDEVSNDTIFAMNASMELQPLYVQTPSRETMNPEVFLYLSKESKDYLFFHTIEKSFDVTTQIGFLPQSIVYSKQEKAFYKPEVYNDDFTNEKKFSTHPMIISTKNNLKIAVRPLDAFDLIESYEKNELKGELKEIASKLDEEDNPVLMVVKYK